MDIQHLADELNRYFIDERNAYFYCYVNEDDNLEADIAWGDWKHDHARFNSLVDGFLKRRGLQGEITQEVYDEDGSDSYSARHVIRIIRQRGASES